MTTVSPFAVIPSWENLTDEQRARYAGNLDPWAGPVDPEAHDHWARRQRQARPEPQESCGCWSLDCAECGPRHTDGQRPPKGHRRRWALRQDAALQRAKETWHERQRSLTE